MLQWGKRVAKDGVYLEFPDIFMMCSMHGIQLQLCSYAEGPWGLSAPEIDPKDGAKMEAESNI